MESTGEMNALEPGELELFIQNIEPTKIEMIGSKTWIDWHQRLQKINQQAVLEAQDEMREEQTKEALISHGKLPVLVHEALAIYVWRIKVLPRILKMKPNPEHTFKIYMVLYHEAACVGLLETVMFHDDSMRCLSDVSADLVDYAIEMIVGMMALIENGYLVPCETKVNVDEDSSVELQRQMKDLRFDIGMRCLSVLRYLTEDEPSARRMCATHDAPLLLASILHIAPWRKVNFKGEPLTFVGGRWKSVTADRSHDGLAGPEASVWLSLMKLLMAADLNAYYKIDEGRRNRLCRLEPMLTEAVLDQLPPLAILKRALAELAVTGHSGYMWGAAGNSRKPPIVIEVVPEIKEKLLQSIHKKTKSIAKVQLETFFVMHDKNELIELAKTLSTVYTSDVVEALSEEPQCAACGDASKKKCSSCKMVYYCGRECQVKDWSKHKDICEQYSTLLFK